MIDLSDVTSQLLQFRTKIPNLPRLPDTEGEKIANILECYAGSLPVEAARQHFRNTASVTLNPATPDPWLKIVFPKVAAEQLGTFGTRLRTH